MTQYLTFTTKAWATRCVNDLNDKLLNEIAKHHPGAVDESTGTLICTNKKTKALEPGSTRIVTWATPRPTADGLWYFALPENLPDYIFENVELLEGLGGYTLTDSVQLPEASQLP